MYVVVEDVELSKDVIRDGYYDRVLSQVVWSLPKGTHVLVAGGNIGYFCVLAARATQARSYAFEPDPRSLEALRYNAGCDDIEIVAAALGDREADVDFILDKAPGNSAFKAATGETIRVPMICGERFLSNHRVDLFILDVQGAELLALKGMGSRLPPWIIFEFWPYGLQQTGTRPKELLAYLRSQDYVFDSVAGIDPGTQGEQLTRWCLSQKDGRGFVNISARKRNSPLTPQ